MKWQKDQRNYESKMFDLIRLVFICVRFVFLPIYLVWFFIYFLLPNRYKKEWKGEINLYSKLTVLCSVFLFLFTLCFLCLSWPVSVMLCSSSKEMTEFVKKSYLLMCSRYVLCPLLLRYTWSPKHDWEGKLNMNVKPRVLMSYIKVCLHC